MWIEHNWGKLQITTAQLDLDINSSEYHNSYKFKEKKTKKEMSEYLEQLLEPCLIEPSEIDYESEEEELC